MNGTITSDLPNFGLSPAGFGRSTADFFSGQDSRSLARHTLVEWFSLGGYSGRH